MEEKEKVIIKKPRENEIRVLILGGIGEFGKNMYGIEYNNQIILFECGLKFAESTIYGIKKIIPDVTYLKERKTDIKGIIITDASMANVGAITSIIGDLNNTKIYTRNITKGIIENINNKIKNPHKLNFHEIEKNETIKITNEIDIHFFGIDKDAPQTFGTILETKAGCISYISNMQIKNTDGVVDEKENERFKILKEKNILLSLIDSTNSERLGFAKTEEEIAKNVIKLVKEAKSRVVLPLFPTQIKRNSLIFEKLIKEGKKIYIQGDSMYDNLITASKLKILDISEELILNIKEMKEEDITKIVVLVGVREYEEYLHLEEAIEGENKYYRVLKEDEIIFPSALHPINSRRTQDLKNNLSKLGANIITYTTSDGRGARHMCKDELKFLHKIIDAKYFIPTHGYTYMLVANIFIAKNIINGIRSIVGESGAIIDISPDGKIIKKQGALLDLELISIDGEFITPVKDIVIRDRKILSEEGIFIIIIFIDQKKLTLKKSPDIISRGFIYLRESQDLISRARLYVKKTVEEELKETGRLEIDTMKKILQKNLKSFLIGETNKKPIVIPVIFM